jgi:hypothetical protein
MRAHNNAVAQGWMAFLTQTTRAPKSNPLVQGHVITNYRSLTNHNPHAVINEEPLTNLCGGMDLDARDGSIELRDDSRENGDSSTIQSVRKPMQLSRVKPGITEHHFEGAARSGVTLEYCLDISPNTG